MTPFIEWTATGLGILASMLAVYGGWHLIAVLAEARKRAALLKAMRGW